MWFEYSTKKVVDFLGIEVRHCSTSIMKKLDAESIMKKLDAESIMKKLDAESEKTRC